MNIQKKTYLSPELTVVTVKAERGYALSVAAKTADQINTLVLGMDAARVDEEFWPNAVDYNNAGYDNAGYFLDDGTDGGYFGGGWN